MLSEANVGILFHALQNIIAEFPQFTAVQGFKDLNREFLKESDRNLG